jgi:hypothetical protein
MNKGDKCLHHFTPDSIHGGCIPKYADILEAEYRLLEQRE